jgi:serine/threonine protein kinase
LREATAMSDEAALDELLSLWQLERARGRDLPALSLCRDRPEIAPELERRIAAVRQMDALAMPGAETVPPAGPLSEFATRPSDSREGEPDGQTLLPEGFPELIGKYRVIEGLGSGGQGEVYRAVHPTLGRDVVIKVARRGLAAEQQKKLIEEGRILARLDDPGLVKVFDVDLHQGRPFVVLEYVAGRTLADVVRHEALPEKKVVALVAELAGIVDRLHRAGVLHRDLKPSNILIDGAGKLRILDFGLSSLESPWGTINPAAPGVSGTLPYMPPEQAAGQTEQIGPRSDLFSLGAVLYHLLTGRPPYSADSPQKLWQQALKAEIPTPRRQGRRLNHGLERICLTALAADPEKRYASGSEMQRALLTYARRPLLRTIGLCLSCLGLLVVLVLAVVFRGGSPPLPTSEESPTSSGYLIHRFEGHRGWVWGVTFAPDGKTALSCSGVDPKKAPPPDADTGLVLWDIETGKRLRNFQTTNEGQLCVAFTPNGQLAVSGGSNGHMHVWDVAGGRELDCFKELHKKEVRGVAVAPDGRRVLSASYDGSTVLWDIKTGAVLRRFKRSSRPVTHVALSSDGRKALTADDFEIVLWNVDDGTELGRKRAESKLVTCVALDRDGSHALSAGNREGIHWWDLESMTELRRFEGHTGVVWRVVLSPDGRRALSAGGDWTVRLWDVESGAEVTCLRGHTDMVYCVSFSPDGLRALSSGQDGSVCLWKLPE